MFIMNLTCSECKKQKVKIHLKKNKNREKMYNRNEKFQIKIAFKFVD